MPSGMEPCWGVIFVEATELGDGVTRLDRGDIVAGLIWGGE